MNEPRPVAFFVGQIEDGRFVATSTSAPNFCFVDATETAVVDQAKAALDFYFSHKGTVTLRQPTASNVINFLPQRRIDVTKEYAFA